MRSSSVQDLIELSDEDENFDLFVDTTSTSTTPLSSAGRKRKLSLKSPKSEADEDLKRAIINVLNKSDEGDKVDDYCKFLAKEMKTFNEHQFFLARQRIDQVINSILITNNSPNKKWVFKILYEIKWSPGGQKLLVMLFRGEK